MDGLFTKQNLALAGAATLAVLMGQNLTAGKGKLTQGAVSMALALLAMHFARKVA